MKIIGIDHSLNSTGVVALTKDKDISYTNYAITYKDKKTTNNLYFNLKRFDFTINKIKETFDSFHPDLVVIEGFAFGIKKTKSLTELGALGWMIRMLAWKQNYSMLIVTPSQLKQFVGESGTCKKNLLMLKIWQKYQVEFKTDDEADAYGLARLGLEYLNVFNKKIKIDSYTEYEKKVLKSLLGGQNVEGC